MVIVPAVYPMERFHSTGGDSPEDFLLGIRVAIAHRSPDIGTVDESLPFHERESHFGVDPGE